MQRTSFPELNRTLATFLSAELGFFGFVTYTRMHTAFICGRLTRAGETLPRARCGFRGLRRTCIKVALEGGEVEKFRGSVVVRRGNGRDRGWRREVVGVKEA